MEITNTYDPTDAELVIDFVSKQLNGRAMTQDDVFTFEVQDLNGTPLLEGKNNASGVVTFNGNLKYDKVGTYYYNMDKESFSKSASTFDFMAIRTFNM